MTKQDIQKYRHLLKRLHDEMMFLRSIVFQVDNLSHQAQFVSTGIRKTWSDIDQVYKDVKQDSDNF